MTRVQYDLTVIGGGSGGLTAARLAAALGAGVLLVDRERLGGDCLRYGCVPSKSLLHVARTVHQAKRAARLGLVPAGLGVDMARVTEYVQGVIGRVAESERVYSEDVTVRFGPISFRSPTELSLDGAVVTSRNTLIATGSRPAVPQLAGLEDSGYLTNEDVFSLSRLPGSIVVAGGGPIGVELAQALARLGAAVTIVEELPRILPREDPEVSDLLSAVLAEEGVRLRTGALLAGARRRDGRKAVTLKRGEEVLELEADELLLALGRRPNLEGLDLAAAGIDHDARGIVVNEFLQTTAPNVFAIGDVLGGHLFSHVAAYQAGVAVRNALVPVARKSVDYRVLPWCTFTDPEAARVGLTVEEAERRHRQIRVVKLPCAEIDRAQAEGETAGFVKLVLTGRKEELVGAHIVAAHAGELLGELALAMRHNLTLNDVLGTIHAYPTMSTGLQQAAFEAHLEGAAAANNRRIVRTVLSLRG